MEEKKKNSNPMYDDIKKACEVMKNGGVILYPTDTIWGIGCDATNEEAVKRVYEIKKRDDRKALLVLMNNPAMLQQYMREVPPLAWDLIELSDKPLTIIYSEVRNLAPNLIAADGTAGIRITNEAFSAELCRQFRRPIVSTSANISGEPTAQNFSQISEEIKGAVDYVVAYRQWETEKAVASSIIKLGANGSIQIIRK